LFNVMNDIINIINILLSSKLLLMCHYVDWLL
jgi:hypothetical protein